MRDQKHVQAAKNFAREAAEKIKAAEAKDPAKGEWSAVAAETKLGHYQVEAVAVGDAIPAHERGQDEAARRARGLRWLKTSLPYTSSAPGAEYHSVDLGTGGLVKG